MMMTASRMLVSNWSHHASEQSDWYDQECSATETSVQKSHYFHNSSVKNECLKQSEHWRIHDLDELDLSVDCSSIAENKKSFINNQPILNSKNVLLEPYIKECTWEDVFNQNNLEYLRDSVIWAPPIGFDTMNLIKRTLLGQSMSSNRSYDRELQRKTEQLKNTNATEENRSPTVGTIYRRLSHPDYAQSATHWVNVIFDFQVGEENRLRMKIRRDISFRYCATVIACQLGLVEIGAEKNIHFYWPNENQELDFDVTATEANLTDNAVIIARMNE